MVFLRLTVKILPREQLASTPSLLRSFLGDRREDSDRNGNGGANGKPASFLLVLEHPDEVTLGGLAGMIQAKWKKLRPEAEPVEIKKLLDDTHDTEDLDADMTVADVFVDNGKARADGLDQRGTVRVIQKPAPYAPVRFSSVVQDWNAAAEDYEHKKQMEMEVKKRPPVPKFETIEEERRVSISESFSSEPYSAHERSTNGSRRQSDVPVVSVERDEPILPPPRWGHQSPALVQDSQERNEVAATPQARRMESKELGESPTPVRQLAAELAPTAAAGPTAVSVEPEANPLSGSQSVLETETQSPVEQRTKAPSTPPGPQRQKNEDIEMTDVEAEPPRSEARKRSSASRASPVVIIDNAQINKKSLASRKRKKSNDQLPPKKEPRLELTSSPSASRSKSKEPAKGKENVEPTGTPSPLRRRDRAPSFSGPPRRPSITEQPGLKPGLGLGITKSPPRKQLGLLDSSQTKTGETTLGRTPMSTTPLFPSSVARRLSFSQPNNVTPSKAQSSPGLEQVKRSAMRKDSPLEKNQERRSVSFAGETDIVTTPAAPVPRSTPQTGSKAVKSTTSSKPTPLSNPRSTPVSSGQKMVYPANVSKERLEQIMNEAAEKVKKEEAERVEKRAELERKMKAAEERGDHEYLRLLRDVYFSWTEIRELEKSTTRDDERRANRLRRQLEIKEKLLREKEAAMGTSLTQEKKSPSGTDGINKPGPSAPRSEPVAAAKKAPAKRQTPEAPPLMKVNGLPQSPLPSRDVNLPSMEKIRSPETKPTTAKREITKVVVLSSDEDGSTEEATSESGQDEKTSAEEEESSAEEEGPEITKAEMLQRVRSPSQPRSSSVPLPLASSPSKPAEMPSTKPAAEAEESSSSPASSSESEEEEDESDDDFPLLSKTNGLPPPSTAPAALRGADLFPNGSSPGPRAPTRTSFGASSQPNSNSKDRVTLKSMIHTQKSEQVAKSQKPKVTPFPAAAAQNTRPPRKDIFDFAPSSSDSESESDSKSESTDSSGQDRGDILPTGNATKIRRVVKRAK